ncbi:FH protein interacting protein FIP2-like [Bidens hawaiensis]|uniref:FH protein interacting protein FIP2-like n=1 Tax=Bidens hawaiensis TaxID=980011 RepID=UPI00404AFBA7
MACSSTIRLNIGGKKFWTTVDTLTQREPQSMLAAMLSGPYSVSKTWIQHLWLDDYGHVFVDRDGKHFRHILNWLRDGVALNLYELQRLELFELLKEAEYYRLLGFVEKINEVLKMKDEQMNIDLTRADIIKYVRPCMAGNPIVKLRGTNLSGLDLSRLSYVGNNFVLVID